MRKARLSQNILQQLITLFVTGTPVRTSAKLCEIHFKTAVRLYHQFRTIIYTHLQTEHYVFDEAIEADIYNKCLLYKDLYALRHHTKEGNSR